MWGNKRERLVDNYGLNSSEFSKGTFERFQEEVYLNDIKPVSANTQAIISTSSWRRDAQIITGYKWVKNNPGIVSQIVAGGSGRNRITGGIWLRCSCGYRWKLKADIWVNQIFY
jgi:hypothetical protein